MSDMLFFTFLLAHLCLFGNCTSNLDISGISSIRFAAGSSLFPQGRDGVIELKYNSQWTAVCNFGFDHIAASTACFMLGFPPYGVAVLNSPGRSSVPVELSNFNCTARVSIGQNTPDLTSLHLGNCEFMASVPEDCLDRERDVSIMCLEPEEPTSVIRIPPKQFSPVLCPNVSKEVRLVGIRSSASAGLVQVIHPETKQWGTVCADGFGVNEAKAVCRMLCSSADDLAYAHPVVGEFPFSLKVEDEQLPIHLARIICPPGVSSLAECSLGGGWGSVKGCTSSMNVGVVCAPQDPQPLSFSEPSLTCDDDAFATVIFKKKDNPLLTPAMIQVTRSGSDACQMNVSETNIEIVVTISLILCGGSYNTSNSTTLAVRLSLFIGSNVSDPNPMFPPRILPITCLMPRTDFVTTDVKAVAVSTLSPIVATKNVSSVIFFYDDVLFKQRIRQPLNRLPERKIYVRVGPRKLQKSTKLILKYCWITADSRHTESTKIALIKDGCPVPPDVRIWPISLSVIGFSFDTSHFAHARPVDHGMQLFVGCDTRFCATFETDEGCVQFCRRSERR